MAERPNYSIVLNKYIRCGKRLTDYELRVLLVILSWRNGDDPDSSAWIYYSALADGIGHTSKDYSNLRKTIKSLHNKGAIRVQQNKSDESKKNLANTFWIVDSFFDAGIPSGCRTPVPSGCRTPVPSGCETPGISTTETAIPSGCRTPGDSGYETPGGEGAEHPEGTGAGHPEIPGAEHPTRNNHKKQPGETTLEKQPSETTISAATRREREQSSKQLSIKGEPQPDHIQPNRIRHGMIINTLVNQWEQTIGSLTLPEIRIITCNKLLEIEQKKLNREIDPTKVCSAAKLHSIAFTDLFKPTSAGSYVWCDLMVGTLKPPTAASGVLSDVGTDTETPRVAFVSPEGTETPRKAKETVVQQLTRAKKTINKKKNPWPEDKVLAIYNAYPRRVGRGAALIAIQKALTVIKDTGDHEDPVVFLLAQTTAYAQSRTGQDQKYTPYPTTWMNELRFCDEFESGPDRSGSIKRIIDDTLVEPVGPVLTDEELLLG